ncbi:MAG: VWA domain-containing protein [Deltaproteobacteria bacterium]|nr:MAG: VWA domain-containing protein [Deltaproteobacteria bacterium]
MKRRETNVFSIAFLDLLSGALGAVIILFVAVPKSKVEDPTKKEIKEKEGFARQMTIEAQKDMMSDYQALLNQKEELEKKVSELEGKNRDLNTKNKELQSQTSQEKKEQQSSDRQTASIPVDVGFKFKGKRVVFVIDVSGSMFMEDKIGQVKAGLKMLITSMGEDFSIDVVHFPDGMAREYRYLWGQPKQMTKRNKQVVYRFLHDLRPWGATPTRATMQFALRNYRDATDIVLLSDGAPTRSNSKQTDDIYAVISDIKSRNSKGVQINTIGVGSDFLMDTNNPKYIFLKRVAEQNQGFFVGF